MTTKKQRYLDRYGIDTRLYDAWSNMRQRCNSASPRNVCYAGVSVCRRWSRFAPFAADMGPHPGKGWTLDRKRNDGNYCKSNCRWATATEQSRNRGNIKLSVKVATKARALHATGLGARKIARICGITKHLAENVIYHGHWA